MCVLYSDLAGMGHYTRFLVDFIAGMGAGLTGRVGWFTCIRGCHAGMGGFLTGICGYITGIVTEKKMI